MKKVIRIFLSLLLVFSVIFLSLGLFFYIKTSNITLDKDKLSSPKEVCKVYNSDLTEIVPNSNFRYVTSDKIPQHLKDAVIAIEDKRFYKHSGVDFKSVLRAVKNNLFSGKMIEMVKI